MFLLQAAQRHPSAHVLFLDVPGGRGQLSSPSIPRTFLFKHRLVAEATQVNVHTHAGDAVAACTETS